MSNYLKFGLLKATTTLLLGAVSTSVLASGEGVLAYSASPPSNQDLQRSAGVKNAQGSLSIPMSRTDSPSANDATAAINEAGSNTSSEYTPVSGTDDQYLINQSPATDLSALGPPDPEFAAKEIEILKIPVAKIDISDVPAVPPINTNAVGITVKAGQFRGELSQSDANGKMQLSTATVCIDQVVSKEMLLDTLGGAFGCKINNVQQDKFSASVTATCPAANGKVASYYSGNMTWSTNGQTIEKDIRQVAMEQGKPSTKIIFAIHNKYSYVKPTCQ